MIDRELIKRMRQGNEDAFSSLVERYSGYVAAVLCNLCRGKLNTQDVEELAADVFLSIWNHAGQIDEDRPLKPYLARAARNSAFSRLRKTKIQALPFEDEALTGPPPGQPDALAERREQTEILSETVRGFGEPEREIFVRYYFFGERLKNIAERLRLNQATARTKLRRCRQRLLQNFQERGYGLDEEHP